MSDLRFDPEALIAEARQATGLSDFGSADFREPLELVCETYEKGGWDERGRRRNRGRLLGLLTTRLRVEAAFGAHPEIADRPIRSPMVLTGLPRSGTSAQFNLLASDPAARPLLLWETQHPDPALGLAPGEADPRYLAVKAHFEEAHRKNPEFTKIHFASADTPEECVLLQSVSLAGVHHGVEALFEPYASWYRAQDLRPMYRYYRRLLQLLDWQRGGERWLLKTPAHMWAIDALVETFPDVSIVWSHRDPLMCTASICSMTYAILQGYDIDKRELGPIVMDFYATSLERGLCARDACEAERFVDVTHDEFVAEPVRVARRIYGHFGLDFGEAVRSRMEAHVAANPRGKHGVHDYSLEEYGLDPDQVRARFAAYIDRFAIPAGAPRRGEGSPA